MASTSMLMSMLMQNMNQVQPSVSSSSVASSPYISGDVAVQPSSNPYSMQGKSNSHYQVSSNPRKPKKGGRNQGPKGKASHGKGAAAKQQATDAANQQQQMMLTTLLLSEMLSHKKAPTPAANANRDLSVPPPTPKKPDPMSAVLTQMLMSKMGGGEQSSSGKNPLLALLGGGGSSASGSNPLLAMLAASSENKAKMNTNGESRPYSGFTEAGGRKGAGGYQASTDATVESNEQGPKKSVQQSQPLPRVEANFSGSPSSNLTSVQSTKVAEMKEALADPALKDMKSQAVAAFGGQDQLNSFIAKLGGTQGLLDIIKSGKGFPAGLELPPAFQKIAQNFGSKLANDASGTNSAHRSGPNQGAYDYEYVDYSYDMSDSTITHTSPPPTPQLPYTASRSSPAASSSQTAPVARAPPKTSALFNFLDDSEDAGQTTSKATPPVSINVKSAPAVLSGANVSNANSTRGNKAKEASSNFLSQQKSAFFGGH